MSILRHDTRHHMAVLRTLIQQGDCEKALEYLNEVSQTYDDTVIKAYCRNEMVNSVLSTYNTRFEEQKIPWDTQVTIGEKLPCSEMMFCAILSNVLENAMLAVQELPESRRRIELSLSEKAGASAAHGEKSGADNGGYSRMEFRSQSVPDMVWGFGVSYTMWKNSTDSISSGWKTRNL